MARRARLTALVVAVFATHLLLIDWAGRELGDLSILKPMAPPMFTRLLKPQEPPAPPAAATKPVKKKRPPPPEGTMAAELPRTSTPKAAASSATESMPATEPTPASNEGGQRVAQAAPPEQPASEPRGESAAPTASGPAAADAAVASASGSMPSASEPASGTATIASASALSTTATRTATAAVAPSTNASAALASWPADTRVNYRLGGQFRGPLYGDARVQWQRDGDKYQVQLDIDVRPWVSLVVTSQGSVTEQGLVPRAYEETRRGKRRAAQLGERAITLDGGRVLPRPEGVQDTASQFVELSHRFATGRAKLEVGRSVDLWLARPGGVDLWTYDVVSRDKLDTSYGVVDAYHLKPRPIANPRGNINAEIWFAPSLQYMPVRVRITMGEAWLDLTMEKIEQR